MRCLSFIGNSRDRKLSAVADILTEIDASWSGASLAIENERRRVKHNKEAIQELTDYAAQRLYVFGQGLQSPGCPMDDLFLLAQRYAAPFILNGTEPMIAPHRQQAVRKIIGEAFREARCVHLREQSGEHRPQIDLSCWFVRRKVSDIALEILGAAYMRLRQA